MRTSLAISVVLGLAAQPGAQPLGAKLTGRVVVMKNGKPGNNKDVWVYLERLDGGRRKVPTPVNKVIKQESRAFKPTVQVISTGSTIAFPNNDDTDHNVFSPSKASSDQTTFFDLGKYGPHNTNSHQFDDEGEFKIYCDIHPQMVATVKVVKSDWMIPVKDNTFTMTGIPPGKYMVRAWRPDIPRDSEVKEQVVIPESGTIEVPELHPQEMPQASHTHQDGRPYEVYSGNR